MGEPDAETLAVAVAQGGRLARVARVIASAQERGLLDARCSVVAKQSTDTRNRPAQPDP